MAIRLLKDTTKIDFAGIRRYAYLLSLIALLVGFVAIGLNKGLNYGVDFAGGVMVQVQFDHDVKDEVVKKSLAGIKMPGLTVQKIGADDRNYMLRFTSSEGASEGLRGQVLEALSKAIPDNAASIQRMEMVGPKVGADLRNMAIEALFYAVLLITVYISGRFEHSWFLAGGLAAVLWGSIYGLDLASQWLGFVSFNKMYGIGVAMIITLIMSWKLRLNFALGAIIALLHDVLITVGLLTLMGMEIDLNIIAALLTLVGYSLNDTIIVYDRIRENLRAVPAAGARPSMGDIINLSVNQTLSRTIMTSATTLFACLSLYLLGGSVIHGFALTILLGVVVGTYSSVFVASAILMELGDVNLYLNHQEKADDSYEKPGEHGMV